MERPNLLLFLPDGMPADVIAPDGDCRTPHFDELARRGVRFTRAHCPLPTCSPSRASLMTGLLPHNHGVLQVEHCTDEDQSVLRRQHRHWAQRLTEAGYSTGYFGKWHIERTNQLEDFGWQVNGCDDISSHRGLGGGSATGADRLVTPGNLSRHEEGPVGYRRILHYAVTDVPPSERPLGRTTERARGFLADVLGGERPWACCVSFSEPNTPVVAHRPVFETYDLDKIRLPANLHDPLLDRPALYRRVQRIYQGLSEPQWRELRAVYYSLITELDEQFGRLVRDIEAAGQLDRTIIIVLSDHGRYLGGHGFDAHNFGAFEEIYRIPLVVAGPGIARGKTTEALVGLHDLCPTLLDLAGTQPIDGPDSRSFASVLHEPATAEARFNDGYAEFHGTRFTLTQRVVWHGSWKLVFNGFDEDELYNLADDPAEIRNLAGDPAHQEQLKEMMARMWRVMRRTNDRALLETHYSPMRFAAVGPDLPDP